MYTIRYNICEKDNLKHARTCMYMFVGDAGMINRSEIKYSMYYGMFEARKGSNTPLVDLSAVSELTDWVNAISEFQSLGSVKGLCECLNREVGKQSDKVKQDQIKYVIRQFEQFDCAWNVNNLYYLENYCCLTLYFVHSFL